MTSQLISVSISVIDCVLSFGVSFDSGTACTRSNYGNVFGQHCALCLEQPLLPVTGPRHYRHSYANSGVRCAVPVLFYTPKRLMAKSSQKRASVDSIVCPPLPTFPLCPLRIAFPIEIEFRANVKITCEISNIVRLVMSLFSCCVMTQQS